MSKYKKKSFCLNFKTLLLKFPKIWDFQTNFSQVSLVIVFKQVNLW